MLEEPGLASFRQVVHDDKKDEHHLPSVNPYSPWLVRTVPSIRSEGSVLFFECPKEKGIVGVIGSVNWNRSCPVAD